MLALRAVVFLVLAASAAASAGQDADAEEATVNSGMGASYSEVSLLQTNTVLSEHAKTQAADRVGRLRGRDTSVAKREDIIWIHVHNCAGTSMCHEAMEQGESTPDANCNYQSDVVSASKENQVHCEQRTTSFSAIERALAEEDLKCKDKLYGVILRDPLANARSTLVHNNFDDIEKQRILSAIRNGESSVPNCMNCTHGRLPDWDNYQHFDNFATRTLSGDYMIPAGKMEMRHLEKAKARLQSMDVVLILEEFGAHVVQLEAFFGWTMTDGFNTTNSHPQDALAQAFTEEEAEFLRTANHLDYELFAFGTLVAANRSAAARVLLGSS